MNNVMASCLICSHDEWIEISCLYETKDLANERGHSCIARRDGMPGHDEYLITSVLSLNRAKSAKKAKRGPKYKQRKSTARVTACDVRSNHQPGSAFDECIPHMPSALLRRILFWANLKFFYRKTKRFVVVTDSVFL